MSEIWDNFEISLAVFDAKYHVQIMLLFLYTTTRKRSVIFKCRYLELSWNTIALSQSNCSNFSCSSIKEFISIGFRKPSCNSHGFVSVLCVSFKVPFFYVRRNVKGVQQIRNRLWEGWCEICSLLTDYAMGLRIKNLFQSAARGNNIV